MSVIPSPEEWAEHVRGNDEALAFKARVMAMELKTGRHGLPAKRNFGRGYNLAVQRAQGLIP